MGKNNDRVRALLVAMPWADYRFPSLQIGHLASFIRKRGIDIECRHLHCEVAALLGLKEYDKVLYSMPYLGEMYFVQFLFPEIRSEVISNLKKYYDNPKHISANLMKAMRSAYRSVEWQRYNIIGFTINYEQLFASLLYAKWLKRDYPKIRIVFGGPCIAKEMGRGVLTNFDQVDWCIDGEGELPLAKLLGCLLKGIEKVGDYVPGLIYRHNGGVRINSRQHLKRLAGMPDPDYDDYFRLIAEHPRLQQCAITPILPIESSRGCTHRCAFCNRYLFCTRYRVRPAKEVASQMLRLSKRYCINGFRFVDSSIPKKGWANLFKSIEQQNRHYYIFYEIRADISKTQLCAMRNAGVRVVQIGIEALETSILAKMSKGTRFIDNLKIMKYCEEVGIEHESNLMLGFPTETQADIDHTVKNIDYCIAYRPPMRMVGMRLDYGSPVFQKQDSYSVHGVRNMRRLSDLLSHLVTNNFHLIVKAFKYDNKRPDYHVLKKSLTEWTDRYNKSLIDGRKLLEYYDLGQYLRVEDFRSQIAGTTRESEEIVTVTLENEARHIYLFCDSIRSWDEIKKRFPKWDPREIKKVLGKLVKLKVMFREDDDYLSLAIRASGPK